MPSKIKTLFLSYECAPFMKKGGLGDVALGLPKALTKLGVDSRVIMPKYKSINTKKYKLKLIKKNVPINLKNKVGYFNIFVSKLPKSETPIYFIDHSCFKLKNIFGYKNDQERFFFFCLASLAAAKALKFKPDVAHCNDWHTGLAPLMLKKLSKKDKFYQKVKTIYTIHNLDYHGMARKKILEKFNIKKSDLLAPEKVSSMAQGIVNADLVGTVSDTYAEEILTKEYGKGLEKFLRKKRRQKKLFGIVNGLDYEVFNPKTDSAIKQRYNLQNINKKLINKEELRKIFNLPEGLNSDGDKRAKFPMGGSLDPCPIIGTVSRLTPQKGLDLILGLLKKFDDSCQFVFLGSGDKKYELALKEIAKRYPKYIGVKIGFDAKLAQKIYAGSDMFLMPSRYEPCGLSQLIAMRYGTVPIVRSTGGLKDTVVNYGVKKGAKPSRGGLAIATGFVFEKYNLAALEEVVKRAIKVYNDKKVWSQLVRNCMTQDFSWERAAVKYMEMYKKIIK